MAKVLLSKIDLKDCAHILDAVSLYGGVPLQSDIRTCQFA